MSSLWSHLQSRYENLFLGPVDARIYAALRIAFAFVSLVNLCDLWPDRESLFTDAGMFDQEFLAMNSRWPYLTLFSYFSDAASVIVIMLISGICMLLLMLGVMPRIAALLVYVWYVSYTARAALALGGWENILRGMSFIMLICPQPKCWSVGYKHIQQKTLEVAPRYGITLIRVQVVTIYWQTLLDRMDSHFWWNGDFMGYFLLSHNARWPMIWVADYQFLIHALTYFIIIIEFLIPILLLVRRWHRLGFLVGFLLHFGIVCLTFNLEIFFLAMMMLYLGFLRQEDIEWLKVRIQRLTSLPHPGIRR